MNRSAPGTPGVELAEIADPLIRLEQVIDAVNDPQERDTKFARAIATLRTLSQKEGIPLAIVGGLAAIRYGYERFTKDIDIVASSTNLDVLARVAPRYGIKVIWKDPDGWHKLQCEGVAIDVVPEGRKPRKDAPTTIPSPSNLGVRSGTGYASLSGWMETKLGSHRVQDQADVVQVIKTTTRASVARVRKHLGKVHPVYLQRFDRLFAAAKEEKQQERERGGAV